MRSRIIYTVGGMAINAKHRRDVEPAYRTGWDEPSLADCNDRCALKAIADGFCPRDEATEYAAAFRFAPADGKAKHRADVAS